MITVHMPTLDDGELIERIAAERDAACLATLYDRHHAEVRRFIGRLGAAPQDLPDLVQRTFLQVVDASKKFDGRASARSWIFGIAVRIVQRHRYSLAGLARRAAAFAREPKGSSTTPEDLLDAKEAGARAMRALDALSAKKRVVFVMVVLEETPCEAVAVALGIPVATVWTRLHHARRELRASLTEEEPSS